MTRLLFLLLLLLWRPARAQTELPRAGAARPLRLIGATGAPLAGSPRDVAWETRGDGVFFTLEAGGTRNIWRAFPDPQDASRYPVWRALPVTTLRAPRYAAAPAPLKGDRSLICVSNVLTPGSDAAQIVRYDLQSATWTALSDAGRLYSAPQISPDQKRVVFAGEGDGQSRVYLGLLGDPKRARTPALTLVARDARRPLWLDDDHLLIEQVAPSARGLFRLQLPSAAHRAQLVLAGGGEANLVGANGLVFSAKTAMDAAPQLYLVARDGSGLRALNGTTGARRPSAARDGKTLAFDAPLNSADEACALWLVPLQIAEVQPAVSRRAPDAILPSRRAALFEPSSTRGLILIADKSDDSARADQLPRAQLSAARATTDGIAIFGIASGTSDAAIILEVGQGEKPRRWEKLSASFPTVSTVADAQGHLLLATWNPPPRARGVWTLRLSVAGLGGAAQSLLRVKLPLPLSPPTQLPPPVAPAKKSDGKTDGSTPLPRATPLPIPPPLNDADSFILPPVADFPIFPMPVAPVTPPSAITPSAITPSAITPSAVAPSAVAPSAVAPPMVAPPAVAPPMVAPPTPDVPLLPAPIPAPTTVEVADFDGEFDISGTPARMAPRQKIKVKFEGQNRGTSTWQTGASGADRVRLVARWVDFSTGTRRQWNFFWLKAPVAPDAKTGWEFDLPAPARAGKYKLIYGLVRLPAQGEFTAPPYSVAQDNWDGEFAAIAFAVEVAAPSP